MRRLVAILAVTLSVAACTPLQVAYILHKDVRAVTEVEVRRATFMDFAVRLHNDPFLVCTRGHESDNAGGYQAFNPGGPAYGAYQFLRGTWNNTARHARWLWLVGVDILKTPGFVQDLMAAHLYRWQGKAPWNYLC